MRLCIDVSQSTLTTSLCLQPKKINVEKGDTADKGACFHGFSVDSVRPILPHDEFIAKGAWGSVFKVRLVDRFFAVKVLNVKKGDITKYIETEKRNNAYMFDYKSSNIVEYFGGYKCDNLTHLVFELGDISLSSLIRKVFKIISTNEFHNVAFQVLEILDFINKIKLNHRDFHFYNMVYLFESDKIKLIDFGKSALPGDEVYKNPLSDLASIGEDLMTLQFDMKIKGKDEDLAVMHAQSFVLFEAESSEEIPDSDNYWFDEFPSVTRRIVSLAFKPEFGKEMEVLKLRENLKPRQALPMTNT